MDAALAGPFSPAQLAKLKDLVGLVQEELSRNCGVSVQAGVTRFPGSAIPPARRDEATHHRALSARWGGGDFAPARERYRL